MKQTKKIIDCNILYKKGPKLCIPTLTINHFSGRGVGGGRGEESDTRSESKNIISHY